MNATPVPVVSRRYLFAVDPPNTVVWLRPASRATLTNENPRFAPPSRRIDARGAATTIAPISSAVSPRPSRFARKANMPASYIAHRGTEESATEPLRHRAEFATEARRHRVLEQRST